MRTFRAAQTALAILTTAVGALTFCAAPPPAAAAPSDFFRVTVVDEQTGRGVPLVELRTVNQVRYVTDSAGIVAVIDPELMGQSVYFRISSPGYEYPADSFGNRGIALKVVAGGSAVIQLERINVAERLYRITGAGIYRDSVLTGQPTPTAHPLLNGLVFGQDTIEATPYHGKLYWFWGDTNRPSYPLGQFATSGATSLLPEHSGLNPSIGVDLSYWVDADGFSKKMIPIPNANGPVWIGGLFTLTANGQEHLYTHYAIVDHDMKPFVSGLAVFDDARAEFTSIHTYAPGDPLIPEGHPFLADSDGTRYVYFGMTGRGAFPLTRAAADLAHIEDSTQFESFTCLAPNSRFRGPDTPLERDRSGRLIWAWKRNTPALGGDQADALIKAGVMRADENLIQLRDIETNHPVQSHGGSVYWNAYRSRWIQITTEVGGSPSFLGEVWFAEADTPVGPWTYARKVATHDHYTFYNPTQDPFFDQNGGRTIYLEGTYVATFSDVKDLTPRYDYNQLMYRLTLDDARLSLPQPVYRFPGGASPFGMREQVAAARAWKRVTDIPFYAIPLARPHGGLLPLYANPDGSLRLGAPAGSAAASIPLCFVLAPTPLANERSNPAVTPLYEFRDTGTGKMRYATTPALPGAIRTGDTAFCRVWRNPSSVVALDGTAKAVAPEASPEAK